MSLSSVGVDYTVSVSEMTMPGSSFVYHVVGKGELIVVCVTEL